MTRKEKKNKQKLKVAVCFSKEAKIMLVLSQ